jgi:NADPH:quinone reductase-like Zn-dependent oxidoreductase
VRAWELTDFGLDGLRLGGRAEPVPGHGEVLVKLGAATLNYRDLLLVQGTYNPKQRFPVIPLSDGAGVVAALGPGVGGFKTGQRVVATFFEGWLDGEPSAAALATSRGARDSDGVASEYRVFPAAALLPAPDYLSDAEAAALPCAALTAWTAIVTLGRVKPGETVLIQGTGGVALFALQFAKLAGACAIVTSSSDEKLERAKRLGADHGINYRGQPEWARAAKALNGGAPLDHVIELGGSTTMNQSLRAIRPGGHIAVIGVLGGAMGEINLPLVVMHQARLQGVTVGSRAGFAAMLKAMELHRLRPVLDQTFAFDDARAAYQRMAAGQHFGKICVGF